MRPAVLVPGHLLASRYRLERELGHGGMGVVWAALDLETQKVVAVKLLRGPGAFDPELRRRLLREARAARAIEHACVVKILDVLELENDAPALVMELLQGETLAAKLDREGRIDLCELTMLVQPLLGALACAHALGIIHRDLKPENVFLDKAKHTLPLGRPRELVRPKILDFGVAKLTAREGIAARSDNQSTVKGVLLGTPLYMSPEQLMGEGAIDARTDIWSLGVLFFQCLTGQFPTTSTNIGPLLVQITTGKLRRVRDLAPFVPSDVDDLVARMLSADPTARPTLREIDDELSPFAPTLA